MAEELSEQLGAQIACTRPLVEAGWLSPKRQIGLSGRTVAPELLITLGISGAIQFIAGMRASGYVIAFNTDPEAPIFSVAHTAVVGDIYETVPLLIRQIRNSKGGGHA